MAQIGFVDLGICGAVPMIETAAVAMQGPPPLDREVAGEKQSGDVTRRADIDYSAWPRGALFGLFAVDISDDPGGSSRRCCHRASRRNAST